MSDDVTREDAEADHDQGDYHGVHEHGHEHGDDERPDYDPTDPQLPSREPPLRSTAPQSDYVVGQVWKGVAVLVVGLALTFGLALALA